MTRLSTPRLVLVPATLELVRAELRGSPDFAKALGAEVPPAWPPPLNDLASMRWVAGILERHPGAVGWAAWYFLRRLDGDRTLAIGTGGFKGPPANGTVEIGYSVLEDHQRQGFAPEAVEALTAWAFTDSRVDRVLAHTLPDGVPSQRVLAKCGFGFVGPGLEEDTVLFARPRAVAKKAVQ